MRKHALPFAALMLLFAGLSVALYPLAASWVAQLNESQITAGMQAKVQDAEPSRAQQLETAQEYNQALISGAILEANQRKAVGDSEAPPQLPPQFPEYSELLHVDNDGLMARLQIPTIDVDLPIYHGTTDAVLQKGAGHLEGTSLPVGGIGTRTVITGHRGLATATIFTNLDKIKNGDTFTFEVMGEAFTYRVFDIKVVQPSETEQLLPDPEKDLATLVTCTPLGINSHRILVTGERVLPAPEEAVASIGQPSGLPHFPWFALPWALLALAVFGYAAFILVGALRQNAATARRHPQNNPHHK